MDPVADPVPDPVENRVVDCGKRGRWAYPSLVDVADWVARANGFPGSPRCACLACLTNVVAGGSGGVVVVLLPLLLPLLLEFDAASTAATDFAAAAAAAAAISTTARVQLSRRTVPSSLFPPASPHTFLHASLCLSRKY